MGEVPVEAKMS